MTPTRIVLGAVAAFTLAGAAAAQDSMTSSTTAPTDRSGVTEVTPPSAPVSLDAAASASAPSATMMGADASVTASSAATPVAGSVTVSTVTNGPVPDTAENRAKYGAPMSRAGKMTRAAGN